MGLERICAEWVRKVGDVDAETAAWDSTADEYVYEAKNNFDEDPFLKFVAKKVQLAPEMRTLDVGCGAGAFSIAMAGRVGQADGCDLSPRMVELGNGYASRNGIGNVRLWVENWHTCDASALEGSYDLSFAHTTPAVCDFETLQKMCRTSREHCFLCTTARRTDLLFDEVRRIARRGSRPYDDHVAYTFEALWYMGYNPEVEYGTTTWLPAKTLAETEAWFLGRLRSGAPVDETTEARIREYLASVVGEDGMVRERIDTTLVNMYWHV